MQGGWSTDDGDGDSIGSSFSGLLPGQKAGPEDISIPALVDEICRIKFPRLNQAGDWELLPSRHPMLKSVQAVQSQAKDLGLPSNLNPCPTDIAKMGFGAVDQFRQQVTKDWEYDGLEEAVEDIQPSEWQSFCTSFGSDAALALVYTAGSMLFGQYFSAAASALTSGIQIFNNVGVVADWVFQFFDIIEDEFNDAIDRLQGEMEWQVALLVSPPFGIGLALAMGASIDFLQTTLHITMFLPKIVQSRFNFMLRICGPLFIVLSVVFVVDMVTIYHRKNEVDLIEEAPAPLRLLQAAWDTEPARGPLLNITGYEYYMSHHSADFWMRMAEAALKFLILGLVKSWPVIRFVTNNLVSLTEHIMNKIVRQRVLSGEILNDAYWFVSQGSQAALAGSTVVIKRAGSGCNSTGTALTRSCTPGSV